MTSGGYKFTKQEAIDNLNAVKVAIAVSGADGITRRQLSIRTGIELNTVTPYTSELRARGLVHSVRSQYEVRWYLGAGNVKPTKTPAPRFERVLKATQITVSTWTPNHSRDELVSALFGNPR